MSKSLEAFTSWAIKNGKVSTPIGTFPGQCVSLVQQYLYQVFDIPFARRGNAKDFVPPTFVIVKGDYKPGDIIRYGASYGGGYGHIGYIDHNGRFVDQNGSNAYHVGTRSVPFSGYSRIYRPTRAFKLKNTVIPTPAPKPAYPKNITVTGTCFVRSAPRTDAKLAGTGKLVAGNTFVSVGLVAGQVFNGNNLWHKSSKGNYVWSGNTNVRK